MDSHHLRDASVSSSQVQESLGPPLWADPQQLPELFRGKHKHRATTQKPKMERQVSEKYKNTYGEMESFVTEQLLPIDGSAGDYRAQDGWYKRVIELSEQPARLLHALLEKRLGARVQVALDEEGLNGISEQLRTALIPLETQEQQKKKMRAAGFSDWFCFIFVAKIMHVKVCFYIYHVRPQVFPKLILPSSV